MIQIENYINGQLIKPTFNQYIDNVDPSRGIVYAQIPSSTKEDVELAVNASKKAFKSWSNMPKEKRSNIMLKVAELIEERMDEFAAAESLDNGKPLSLAKAVDIPRAVSNFKFFATAILHYASESHYMEGLGVNYTVRKPIGVVGCISPWNLPLYLFTWKIAPALAAGNCVVAKPSEITPMTAYLLSKACIDAGMPEGVLNIVHGLGQHVGDAITRHKDITAISFTGRYANWKNNCVYCCSNV